MTARIIAVPKIHFAWWLALCSCFLGVYIGTALFVYYKPKVLPEGISGDQVFLITLFRLAHRISGLLIASILAAGMSTVSTSLNSSSTVILTRLYQRIRKRKLVKKRG